MERAFESAQILIEALPYIQKFQNKVSVIKIGGEVIDREELVNSFVQDVVLLQAVGINVVVVHGGGKQVERMLERLGVKTEKVQGMRVTDEQTMEVVEMVLGGIVNKDLVARINLAGGKAIGISGKDGLTLIAEPLDESGKLGAVGKVIDVNRKFIQQVIEEKIVPVIAPIGVDYKGKTYNINADLVAGALASALSAEKLVLLTDVEGVKDKDGKLISSLHAGKIKRMIDNQVISGGMVPKVNCCLEALRNGVHKTHIIDGRIPHSVLVELFTDKGMGTEIYR